MKNNLMIYLSTYFEVGAFLASLFAWQKIKHIKYLRLFPFLLVGIVAGELAGAYILYATKKNNALLYNICITPFINIMYYGIVYLALQNSKLKKGIIVFAILYAPFAILTTLRWYNNENSYNILSHSIGSLFLIISLFRLFYEMLLNPFEFDFLKRPSFYIFFALLLFHVASLAYFVMANWLIGHAESKEFLNALVTVLNVLNYILYGTYIIVFIWIRWSQVEYIY